MKNYVPLILAVLLGLAAVLAVGRLIAKSRQAPENMSTVVAAVRKIAEGETLHGDALMKKEVPVSARPADALPWSKMALVEGQKAKKAIAEGDYVLLSDIGLSRSMANLVGDGEWAVTLNIGNSGVARVVQPGDEVAVIGTFNVELVVQTTDLSAPGQKQTKEVTMVLFPRVRVLDVGGGRMEGGGDIVVALPPQQAQVLIAAQRKASLTLALRKAGDPAALNRVDTGMVDAKTFVELLKDLKSIEVPKVPGAVEAAAPAK
jgi:Flp pilus assembly protein CpaB